MSTRRALATNCFSRSKIPPLRHLSNQADSLILRLPLQFLRASDHTRFDKATFQRNDVIVDSLTGKVNPSEAKDANVDVFKCSMKDGRHVIEWSDGVKSTYEDTWVKEQLEALEGLPYSQVLWTDMTEEKARTSLSINFDDLLLEEGQRIGLETIHMYGILLVTSTPIDDGGVGISAMASALGGGSNKTSNATMIHHYLSGGKQVSLERGTDGPLRTLYGTVWATAAHAQSDGASVADSAYTQDSLPLHTDMTYALTPPGLQIFTMVESATQGGESVYADGFAAAERLRATNPDAFDILSKVDYRYRCVDSGAGWHLEAHGPVITQSGRRVVSIRHNDLDRLPALPLKGEDPDMFYARLADAHNAWDTILNSDEFRLVITLNPGDTMVVANDVRDMLNLLCCKIRIL